MSATATSATSSVRTSGVLVTLSPRDLQYVDGHAVVADAEHRDDLELRQRIEQRGRRHRAAALHQPADRCRRRAARSAGLSARLRVFVAVVVGLQRIAEKRRKRRGDDDVVLHGVSCLSVDGRRTILASRR